MKYTRHLPKTDKRLSEELEQAGWRRIREPGSLAAAVLLSLPLSYLLFAGTACVAYVLEPELFRFMTEGSLAITLPGGWTLLFFAASVYLYMLAHEMLHAVFIPNFISSDRTEWGLNGAFGFVVTTEPMKKSRFLLISCMPFLLLSVIAPLLLERIGYLNGYTLALCLINAAGSGVDFLNFLLVAVQVKRGGTIINNGFETYYRVL